MKKKATLSSVAWELIRNPGIFTRRCSTHSGYSRA
jgi:hypothetical protein